MDYLLVWCASLPDRDIGYYTRKTTLVTRVQPSFLSQSSHRSHFHTFFYALFYKRITKRALGQPKAN